MLPDERVGVIGLGYVGLPVALAFAERFEHTIGMDINEARVAELSNGFDRTQEVEPEDLAASSISFTSKIADLADCTFLVVTVPTPIDGSKRPDLGPLRSASEAIATILKPGMVVVYESTVYPGVTEDFCGALLEEKSGLELGVDFTVGYSPERINPGDREHTIRRVIKVVAGQDEQSAKRVYDAYAAIVDAGVHLAPSIRAAEAAKVVENTQRDVNIALMNELALIFERSGIRTIDVLKAAGTKWNFLPFRPGLVGGHCIGVDPYYLTSHAQELGYHPEVILAGRRINDGMGAWVAQRALKMLAKQRRELSGAKVGVFGITFKENVPDIRNSRVPDIIAELEDFGVSALVFDPLADPAEVKAEYGIELVEKSELTELDMLIVAVPHAGHFSLAAVVNALADGGVLVDVKSLFEPKDLPDNIVYWSL